MTDFTVETLGARVDAMLTRIDTLLLGRSILGTFQYSTTTTDADPGVGTFRFNNATIASVSALYLDPVDLTGADLSAWIDTFDDANTTSKGSIVFRGLSNAAAFAIFAITGAVTSPTGYKKLTLVHVASGGAWANNDRFTWSYLPRGDSGLSYGGTSTSSLAIGTGSKSLTTQPLLAYQAGARVRVSDSANPSTKWMEGVVTSYNATTGALVFTSDAVLGTGTVASWTINLTGEGAQAAADRVAAAASATAAAASQSAAATSASNAATSATNAATSETAAATSASGAATDRATVAADKATVAADKATVASDKAAAATSATNAAASATTATTQAGTATTQASNASTSATNASSSASAASTSATNAASSATAAAASATASAASAAGYKDKPNARAATTAALPSCTYSSNVLTATANGALAAQDGVTLTGGQLLLVKDQAAALQNGLYNVTQVGSAGTPFILTRAGEMDIWSEVPGARVWVEEGTTQADSSWLCTGNQGGTIGSTGISWIKVFQSGMYGLLGSANTWLGRQSVSEVSAAAIVSRASGANTGYAEAFVARIDNNAGGTNYTELAIAQDSIGNLVLDVHNQANAKGNLGLMVYGGNVGIGTSSPGARLDVVGGGLRINDGNSLQIKGAGGGTDQKFWDVYSDNTASNSLVFRAVNDAYSAANTWLAVERSGYQATNIRFATGAGVERMRINATGVGIGTSAPDAPLSIVDGGTSINGVKLEVRRAAAGDVGISFHQAGVNSAGIVMPSGLGDLSFRTGYWTGGAGTEIMRLKADGKVGIGTSSPSVDLDLIRSVNATSTIRNYNNNAGVNAGAGLQLATGTANSYVEQFVLDNAANPYFLFSAAAGIPNTYWRAPNFTFQSYGGAANLAKISSVGVVSELGQGTYFGWEVASTFTSAGGTNILHYGMSRGGEVSNSLSVSGWAGVNFYTQGALRGGFSGVGKFAVGRANTGSMSEVYTTADINVNYSIAANGSFTQTVLLANCTRSNTSAYHLAGYYSSNLADAEFILRGDGNAYADGSWTGGGADYAEYFEWADGNPGDEDRRGFSVVLIGDQIRKALSTDDPADILGVISGNPSVVGDAAWNMWKDKYVRDEFGTYIREPHTITEWTDVETWEEQAPDPEDPEQVITVTRTRETPRAYESDKIPEGVTVPQSAVVKTHDEKGNLLTRRILNSDYDPNEEYTPRELRPEWSTVGLMGKLRIRSGQPTGDRWRKMRDVSANVEEWLVR